LGPGILGGVQEHIVGDLIVVLAVGLAGRCSKDTDREAGVASGCVGDSVELIVGDDVLGESSLCPHAQDVVQLLVVVLVHPDVFTRCESNR
jgi:hypothetical protein